MDDCLSAVDVHVGTKIFQDVIKNYLSGKTIIFVTHNMHYTKKCDLILVLKEGKLVEQGTYNDLLDQNGHFKELAMTDDKNEEVERKKSEEVVEVVKDQQVKTQSTKA